MHELAHCKDTSMTCTHLSSSVYVWGVQVTVYLLYCNKQMIHYSDLYCMTSSQLTKIMQYDSVVDLGFKKGGFYRPHPLLINHAHFLIKCHALGMHTITLGALHA